MSGTIDQPGFAFHDVPADALPITFYAFRTDSGEKIWEERIEVPGALRVPPLAREQGCPVVIVVTDARGQTEAYWPPCSCGHEWSHHQGMPLAKFHCRDCACVLYQAYVGDLT